MSDDYSADVQTTGAVAVGGSATGSIETAHDQDWFAVELEAGRTYQFDLGGSPSGGGTLSDTFLRAIYDSEGRYQSDSYNDDFEGGRDSRVTFTASQSGTYYVRASGDRDETGSYTLRVSDVTPGSVEDPPPGEPPADTVAPAEADPARAAAEDLGDITELAAARFPLGTLDGGADGVGWYRFTLSEARAVGLGLRRQDADADLVLEDAEGNVLHSSANGGTANEWMRETLLAGTYYVGVEAQEAGANAYVFRYGVGDADPAEVARLEAEQESAQEQVQQQPPAFGSRFYGFELPEDTDGSANRISLGTVSATDPDGGSVSYSIEGGNAAGLFEIDAASGELFYTGGGEDYETGSTSFELTVRASDGDQTTDTTATVSVTDVDEPVEVDPPVAQDQSTPQTVSEPAGEDFSAGASTSGRVAVGDTATGNIGSNGDRDWFAVELVAGRTYVIDLRGSPTDDGTLSDPYLGGIHDSDGNLIARTTNDDGGEGYNSRVTFTATESGTHYIAAGAAGIFSGRGTYEVEVTDTSPPEPETAQAQDEAPEFAEASYAFDLAENTDGSTASVALGTVSATDRENSTLTYSIEGGNSDGLFAIDSETGALSYQGTGEDYESGTTSYNLTVRGSDGSLHSDVTARVNIIDVAESVSEPQDEDFPDDTTTTGRVVVGDTVNGNIGTSFYDIDQDWFAVDLVAGRTYVIDLGGSGAGDDSLIDPYLRSIYDSDGTWISGTRDDDGGDGLNSRVTFTATQGGTHYISVGGHVGSQGAYELTVTDTTDDPAPDEAVDDFAAGTTTTGTLVPDSDTNVGIAYGDIDSPGDVDWFAIDLEANQSVIIRLTGYIHETWSYMGGIQTPDIKGIYNSDGNLLSDTGASGWREARLLFKATDAGTYYVAAGSGSPNKTGKYTLAMSPGPTDDDYTGDTSTTGEVAVGGSVQGNIEWEDDSDWFAAELTAGVRYEFSLTGAEDSPEYPVFGQYIRDSQGNPYVGWRIGTDSEVGPDNTINHGFFTPEISGTYYIPVTGGSYDSFWHGNRTLHYYWDEALAYTLTVTEAEEQPPADDYSADTTTTGEVAVDGDPVSGEIGTGNDVDWFAVDLVAGKTYVFIQRDSLRSDDNTLRSPSIVGVYDSDGNAIADTASSYASKSVHGARVTYEATETGIYYIAASSERWGTRTGTYSIEAHEIDPDSVPADTTTTKTMEVRTVWFEVELDASKPYIVKASESDGDSEVQPFKVDVYDADGTRVDSGGFGDFVSKTVRISSRENSGGTYYIEVTTDTDNDGTDYTIEAHEVDPSTDHTTNPTTIRTVDVTELEDAPEWAEGLPGRTTGIIESVDDVDWIKIDLEEGRTYDFYFTGQYSIADDYPGGSGWFKFDGIYGSNGDKVDVSDSDSGSFSYEVDESGTYYLAVEGGDYYGLGRYWVSVEEQETVAEQTDVI